MVVIITHVMDNDIAHYSLFCFAKFKVGIGKSCGQTSTSCNDKPKLGRTNTKSYYHETCENATKAANITMFCGWALSPMA